MKLVPIIASSIAVLVSTLSSFHVWTHDPLGKGLAGYDFSTPEAACKSRLQINANQDFRASLELQELTASQKFDENIETLSVHKEVNSRGQKLLFISYNNNGRSTYEVQGFEKKADSGMWFPKYVSSYSVKQYDPGLAEEMDSWKALSDESSAMATFSEVVKQLGEK
ncbi:MAG: hypothetical protein NXI32_11470 [bacterium]|nr:hypothetical protein [bacterium]